MRNRSKTNPLIPLNDAVWDFATRSLQERWRNARTQSASLPGDVAFTGELTDAPEFRWVEAVAIMGEMLGSAIERYEAKNAPLDEMRDHLLQRISAAKLEAWGVQVTPQLGAQPELIPPFVFKNRPNVDWRKNSIENVGRRYEAVEVRRLSPELPLGDTASGVQKASRPTELRPTRPKAGRPSSHDAIRDAIHHLMSEDPSFCSLKRKVAVESVRRYLKKRDPEKFADGRGLADTTIEKRVSALCRVRLEPATSVHLKTSKPREV